MKIKKYFDIYYKDMIVNHNHSVKNIVENSKMASLNSVFVAIRGYKHNGLLKYFRQKFKIVAGR